VEVAILYYEFIKFSFFFGFKIESPISSLLLQKIKSQTHSLSPSFCVKQWTTTTTLCNLWKLTEQSDLCRYSGTIIFLLIVFFSLFFILLLMMFFNRKKNWVFVEVVNQAWLEMLALYPKVLFYVTLVKCLLRFLSQVSEDFGDIA